MLRRMKPSTRPPPAPGPPTWGVVATVKAPLRDVLNFAAHHLELGAHRVHVFLDEPNEPARRALRHHPKCRVITCDDAYWQKRGRARPARHQVRQTINASFCLRRRPQVDWLAHIDVDEFLWPDADRPLHTQLAALPADTLSARARPIEALAPDPADPPDAGVTWFRSCARLALRRREETDVIYPRFGPHLNGGFMSHVVGKVFVRTGVPRTSLRIHNAFRGEEKDSAPAELPHTALCHLHAPDWSHFLTAYRFRLAHGSYRAGLSQAPLSGESGLNMHALLAGIEAEGGEQALRAFYRKVCTATPDLRERLTQYGHLHAIRLDLDAKRARYFPGFA